MNFPLLYPVQEHDSPVADRVFSALDQADSTLAGLAQSHELTRDEINAVVRVAKDRISREHPESDDDAEYIKAAVEFLDSL